MNTKLTLRLDEKLIASAKRHSAESGKSVSKCHTCADEHDCRSCWDATPMPEAPSVTGGPSGREG